MESLIGIVALVALVILVARQHSRLALLEREVRALRSLVLSLPATASEVAPAPTAVAAPAGPPIPDKPPAPAIADAVPGPAERPVEPPPQPARPKRDLETALGTRWAVWVGGLALALGGIFLVRYSIEAGIFGPGVRIVMAGLFGIALLAAGEFVRRTGFTGPVEGAAGAYVPGILTAAGAFVLFGAVYAAHGVYGFIGPATAFLLLGVVAIGTMAAALAHGRALAGVGLLGSLVTPLLVSSQAPNAWALFGYLAVVLIANTAIARLRDWRFLAAGGFVGTGLWLLIYIGTMGADDATVILFACLTMLVALGAVWLRARPAMQSFDYVAAIPALFCGLSAIGLFVDPAFAGRGETMGALLVLAMLGVALYRPAAIALLHGAGIAVALVHLRAAIAVAFSALPADGVLTIDGLPAGDVAVPSLWLGVALGVLFAAAGIGNALRIVRSRPRAAASWAAWGAAVPIVVVGSRWLALGNIDRDLPYAILAVLLAIGLVAAGEALARREEPALKGGAAVSATLAGAGAALLLAIHAGFGPGTTTVLVGAAAALPAFATRIRPYPVLGWLCLGAVVATALRIGLDPTIVGADRLGRTPVFNALLPGYAIPALAFGYAAWQLARTTNGRPRLAMEAAAALFALLAIAMLVRHAMNGGVIDATAPTLAEQAIYTLLAIGAGAILTALDLRSPSVVFRVGSLAAGVVSVGLVAIQHFGLLNPLFTDESTGRIPFFNLLFLAYLLPAIAAGGLALYARGRRPPWYGAMLGLLAACLAFAYATLSLRRLFQGEHIALWSGIGNVEYYAYSALWLAIGVALLATGVLARSTTVRIASGVLIAVAVAKVFLLDMSELEGVLRALSFIGLGAVLIGIGLFYQRLLSRTAARPA